MLEVNVRLDLPANIDGLAIALSNLSEPLTSFQSYRRQEFENQIGAELSPDRTPIPPLSARYAQWKAQKFPGRPMRVKTGATVQSYRSQATSNALTEELRSPYVNYVQRGSGRMPSRPYFPESMSTADRQAWEAIATRYILQNWRRS